MKHYDRTTITEEPAPDPEAWKGNYLRQLRKARETGRPLQQIIDADQDQRDHLTTRLSLRRDK